LTAVDVSAAVVMDRNRMLVVPRTSCSACDEMSVNVVFSASTTFLDHPRSKN